jgi:hypothetical protein
MEETINPKSKSVLEKMAPYVLIVGAIVLGYFLLSKLQIGSVVNNNVPIVETETIQVEVDTNFLVSNDFIALKYFPDSAVFNDVNGEVPSGREDPFAPVK